MKEMQTKKMFYGILSDHRNNINNEFYLHCWDGTRLFQLDTLRMPKDTLTDSKDIEELPIMEMQAVGRGTYK